MNILALETTCDETAAAVVTDGLEVLASVVASQDELHRRFGGVVPEIASRAHLERILPVIHQALRAGPALAGRHRRRGRGQHAGAGRLAVGRPGGGQGPVRGARHPVGGGPSSASPHLRLPHGRRPARGLPLHRADRQRRAHESLPLPRAAGFRAAGGDDRRRRGRGLRQSGLDAGPALSGRAGHRARRRGRQSPCPCPAPLVLPGRRAARFQLQRPEDRGALHDRRPGPDRFHALGTRPATGGRPGRQLSRGGGRHVLVDKAFAALRRTGLRILCVGGGVAANARLRSRLEEEARRRGVQLHVAPPRLVHRQRRDGRDRPWSG